MQAHPIYIPTDRMNFQADSQTVLHNINTASTENLNESVDSGRSRESWREPKKTSRKKHYVDGDSGPEEKLAHALTMVEEFIQEKEIYEANKELIRCVALTRIIHGDGHWRLAQSFANLAYGYLTLRAFPVQALQHAESAKEILLNGLDMSKSEEEKREILETLVTIYYTLGAANLMQNKESLYNLQKVEKILEELQALEGQKARGLKISNIDLAVSLGRACALQNKLSLAAGYFANAIDIVNMTEGDRVPQLISIYQEMAKVEQLRSRHDRAIEHLLQAHSISKALHNKGSVEAAETALVLAKAYAISGNFQSADVAEMYFAESLNAYQTALGPDDSRTLSTLVEYSKWLVQIGRNQEAYKLLNSTCRSQLKSSGEFSETVAEVLNLMGAICVAEGKMQKAHQLLSRCLEIQTTVYGSQHKKPRQTQELLNMLKSASTGAGNKTR